jgi:hypothetical protein
MIDQEVIVSLLLTFLNVEDIRRRHSLLRNIRASHILTFQTAVYWRNEIPPPSTQRSLRLRHTVAGGE